MNLLFLDSIAGDVYGGLESWIGMVSAGLVERGHRVSAVGRPGSEYLRRTALLSSGIEIIAVPISGDFNPVTIAAIKRILDERATDAIICNFNKDVRLGGLAARWRGTTRVIWRLGNNLTSPKAVHRYLTPRLLDGAITPSHELKRQVVESGYINAGMVEVIHTGVRASRNWLPGPEARSALREKYRLPSASRIAVTSGRFVSQKGHRYLVEASAAIVGRHPDVHYLWLGDGPLEGELREQIEGVGLADRFVFAGLLDDFELEMAGSDLMIHPATIEPFGIVLLEAMRVGLPIVASRVGGIPEVVADTETGCLIPPEDPNALSEAVTGLLDDPRRMAEFGSAARERWRTEFDYDVMIGRLEKYLGDVIDGRREGAC